MEVRTVSDVMTTNPVWCVPQDSIDTVARMMMDADCGAIPVVDDPVMRRLVGIVTARDIVRRVVAQGHSGLEHLAGTVMTRDPVSLHPGATPAEAARFMEETRVRRIPIVDDRGRLVGIVTREDLARIASEPGAQPAQDGIESGDPEDSETGAGAGRG